MKSNTKHRHSKDDHEVEDDSRNLDIQIQEQVRVLSATKKGYSESDNSQRNHLTENNSQINSQFIKGSNTQKEMALE